MGNIRRFVLLAAALTMAVLPAEARRKKAPAPKVKVACVGNSITYGMRLEDREHESYPVQLQALLGDGYEVGNFGKSGATLLRHGHRPYFEQEEYRAAMAFAGDIVVIHLGINDTDPRNWPFFEDEFVGDYLALIDSLRSVNPKARFLVARMTPIGSAHSRFISGTKDWHGKIQREIERVAHASGAELIDFYDPLYPYPWLFPDAIHPNAEGAGILARTVYQAVTGNYGGLQVSPLYTDNMVLPRGKRFTVRGLADAGEPVTVSVDGAVYRTVAGKDGRWSVVAGPFPAGTDAELVLAAPSRTLRFRNVAFGDIWLCSGQSNMEFEVRQSSDAAVRSDADLRLYDMKSNWRTDNVAWPASALDSVAHLQYFAPASWMPASEDAVARFSAVGYAFGSMLRDSLRVPVGLICNAVGGSTAESWIGREQLETQFPAILRDWLHNDLVMEWARGRAEKNLSNRPASAEGYAVVPTRHPYEPCYLYEAGILPLDRFPVTGVIWYQGESNAERLEAHERLFPLLVDSWRDYFGEELPFYYVQLSSLNRTCWPVFRDSQRRLLDSRPGLGMAVSSDLGDPYDVHYHAKRPVGERLALQALAKHYGMAVQADGPLAREASPSAGSVLVDFGPQTGLHASDGQAITGFEVLDAADGKYHPVSVMSVTGGLVRLDCTALREPAAVRYAWQPYTRANLVNAAGLPASTFRMELN